MCFHASLAIGVSEIENQYQVSRNDVFEIEENIFYNYHLNGFDHPEMPIITQENNNILDPAIWGIIDPKESKVNQNRYYQNLKGGGLNARNEKAFTNSIYKECIFNQRCIIPLTGFFEPHSLNGKKYPYYFQGKDKKLLSVAGIYSRTYDGAVSFSMLTKSASSLFAEIHNTKEPRQIILLDKAFEREWLRNDLKKNHIKELINIPYDNNALNVYPVSKDVFNTKVPSNYEEILDKVDYRELIIAKLFNSK